ncbi:MAG: U32 family peptidase [Pseudomonadota bacterium]
MTTPSNTLELLAPAKNLEFGMEAIKHGADAVYIGGPMFGARANAGNAVADIGKLAAFAHRYHARVLVALNTILTDAELEEAAGIVRQVYEAGADALIVQDMGLLELDLPPIELHASTQTDNRSVEKVKFLEDVGFSQIVLARELSLREIRAIAAKTSATLEFFIHGALCVAYSGQCYISHAHTGRSANRGECSQACRLPYDLADSSGKLIGKSQHLLSMKDNNQTDNLDALIEAGIRSFKIEGRLKNLSYVKNVTAHYRRKLDALMEAMPQYRRSSSGRSSFTFTPQPEKTFNREATDYFVNERKADIGAFDSPKFAGEHIGHVARFGTGWFEVTTKSANTPLHNGDGLTYYNGKMELQGVRINRVEPGKSNDSYQLFPAEATPGLAVGMPVYRNRDQAFERLLEKPSAERKIAVRMKFAETPAGFSLTLTDADGISANAAIVHAKEVAQNSELALATLREHLGKLGNTDFVAEAIELQLSAPWFLPVSQLNALRRDATEQLIAARLAAHVRPQRKAAVQPPVPYPEQELSYLANVLNDKARQFYARHGVHLIDAAYETNQEKGMVSLMITKHCLRYSFNLCPKQVKGIRPDPLTLINGKEKLLLRFDCKPCEMHVVGKLKRGAGGVVPIYPARPAA